MRSVPRSLAFALTLAALAPGSGQAFDQPGCGGTWEGATSCRLVFEGFPITVFADTVTDGGRVQVRLTLDGYEEVELLACEGIGSCEDELRLEGLLEDPLPIPPGYAPAFRCHVEGDGEGLYFCGSGGRTGGRSP